MDEGSKYRIWYKDDLGKIQSRSIRFLKETSELYEYINLDTDNKEGIAKKMLLRYRELRCGVEDGKKSVCS